jgi:hypothetical protein
MSPEVQRLALRHLASSLAIAALMLLAGSALLWLSQKHLLTARQTQAHARDEARKLHDRYQATRRDEDLLRDTIGRFEILREQGLIGPENRLDWANAVRGAVQNRRLESVEFSITPQRNLIKLDAAGLFSLNISQMNLSLGLLHEGELLRLLDDLSQQPDALVQARHCRLTRQGSMDSNESAALKAECELDWLSISQSPAAAPQRQP